MTSITTCTACPDLARNLFEQRKQYPVLAWLALITHLVDMHRAELPPLDPACAQCRHWTNQFATVRDPRILNLLFNESLVHRAGHIPADTPHLFTLPTTLTPPLGPG